MLCISICWKGRDGGERKFMVSCTASKHCGSYFNYDLELPGVNCQQSTLLTVHSYWKKSNFSSLLMIPMEVMGPSG